MLRCSPRALQLRPGKNLLTILLDDACSFGSQLPSLVRTPLRAFREHTRDHWAVVEEDALLSRALCAKSLYTYLIDNCFPKRIMPVVDNIEVAHPSGILSLIGKACKPHCPCSLRQVVDLISRQGAPPVNRIFIPLEYFRLRILLILAPKQSGQGVARSVFLPNFMESRDLIMRTHRAKVNEIVRLSD